MYAYGTSEFPVETAANSIDVKFIAARDAAKD